MCGAKETCLAPNCLDNLSATCVGTLISIQTQYFQILSEDKNPMLRTSNHEPLLGQFSKHQVEDRKRRSVIVALALCSLVNHKSQRQIITITNGPLLCYPQQWQTSQPWLCWRCCLLLVRSLVAELILYCRFPGPIALLTRLQKFGQAKRILVNDG